MLSEANMRPWENWDKGETARLIDRYWASNRDEIAFRKMVAADIEVRLGRKIPLLEIGCGSGLIYAGLRRMGIVTPQTYTGGDVSAKMLEIARKRFPEARFVKLDVLSLPYPDNSQPNVICVQVLQHLPSYEEAMKELLRITASKLYIVSWFTPNADDEFTFSDIQWGGPFYNNCYSLPRFLSFVYRCATRPIEQAHIRHLVGPSYSITLQFH